MINETIFDIQHFANPNTNVTVADGTPGTNGYNAAGQYVANDLSPEMKTWYERRLIDNAEPFLVHNQFGDQYPIPKNGGKSIEFRSYAPLAKAMTPLVEGITPDGNHLSVSAITATVDQYGDYITVSDVLDLTGYDHNLEQATQILGSQAGRTLDSVTRDILAAGTNVMYAPKVVSGVETEVTSRAGLDATALLTMKQIFRAVARLKSQNTRPIDGAFVGIVHPNVATDLMTSDQWVDVHKYATPENIYEGEIGKLAGVRFVETTEAKIIRPANAQAGAPSIYCTLILGANAYGITTVEGGGLRSIIKQLGSTGSSDPLNQRATSGWKALATAEILVQQYLIRIEHCCETEPAAAAN